MNVPKPKKEKTYLFLQDHILINKIDDSHIVRKTPYIEEELRQLIQSSFTLSEVARKINRPNDYYRMVFFDARRWNIDISHCHGRQHLVFNEDQLNSFSFPIELFLENKIPARSHNLKLRLIQEGYKKALCESCGRSEYLGSPVPLELNHKDGNENNNLLDNLEIICVNCHSQTDTFAGRNPRTQIKMSLLM